MPDKRIIDYIKSLPLQQRLALANNLPEIGVFASQLAAIDAVGEVFSRSLDYNSYSIANLVKKGQYLGYCNQDITDVNYPVKGEGVAELQFRILNGANISHDGDHIYYTDVVAGFLRQKMRFCNPAEGLVVPAEDHEIGKGYHLVILLANSNHSFFVTSDGTKRLLHRNVGRNNWPDKCCFLGVCEQSLDDAV